MSDFFGPQFTRRARKAHRCTWCGEAIERGATYEHQRVHYDGAWQENRMHPECNDACNTEVAETGEREFMPHSNERPRP